ncbi:MAG: peptide ABC transporter substrate-binding protein [Dehalococcoidales bacterium]|nr:peptide ABC transporter substrate-binding protein [Dehalococcoidales bacterium]
MKKALIILILALTLGTLVLTGCNGSGETTTVSPTDTPTDMPTDTPTGSTTVSPSGTPGPAVIPPAHGTLRLAGVDPYTLDPGVAMEMTSHTYITQIYGGLVRLDENLRVVPDIAERWDISPDRMTYTFYLRRDVTFHDGQPVTAADVVYSWERACTPATGSSVAATYLGDIIGVNEMLAGQASAISGVRVLDDDTIEVTIDAPKSYFLSKLTYPTAYVLDEDTVAEGANWWRRPNGTGPFKLVEWVQGEALILERNEAYHGRVASLERVEYYLWSGVPMNMYETDEIDVTGVSVYYIDRVQDPAGPFYGQLKVTPELSFSFFGFNTTTAPFDDVHVRRAFTCALDKEKIISVMYRDLVESAGGILPPGIPGYNEQLAGFEYDVDRAREEMALSRYGEASALPPITITTAGYGGNVGSYIEAAIVQWRENLGVEVTVRQLEPERYFYNLTEEKDEMFEMGWVADYPHPQNFLDILFRTGQENNFAEYSNPALDALLGEAAVAGDADGLELYRQAEQILVDDAACLPLWYGQNYSLVKPHVQGYTLNAMGLAMLNRVSITD